MLRHSFPGLAILSLLLSPARGELLHQYTFNDQTANDSVGNQHGTVVNPMGLPAFVPGHLDLRANNTATGGGINSNQQGGGADPTAFTDGLYVDLPNFMISDAAFDSGGVLSFEVWFTAETGRGWARVFDFGDSNLGEDTATSGQNRNYLFFTPQRGGDGSIEFTTHNGNPPPITDGFAFAGPTPRPGVQHHFVGVLDQTDTTVGPDGSLYAYLDGVLVDEGPVAGGFHLPSVQDVNNWLGRSQWPDPLFDGTYNEFRIYDHALSAQEVADSYETGPEGVNPRFIINRDDQSITLVSRGTDGDVAGYSLTSAAGGLDSEAWTPISGRLDSAGDDSFDPDSAWTVSANTSGELTEAADTGTGGQITGATEISLGNIWLRSPSEDVVAMIRLTDGSSVGAEVQFVGNNGDTFGRSDLNFDGVVDINDWPVFVSNLFGDFAGQSAAAAYGQGDLNGDLVSDINDFQIFRGDFDAANGAGAFAALVGVPEPSTLVLSLMLVMGLAMTQRRLLGKCRVVGVALAVAGVFVVGPVVSTHGDVIHRWSFNEAGGSVVTDSVGGAHGVVRGAGGVIADGEVTLPGGGSATAAYVDLPNGLISGLSDATFEGWATLDGAQNWGRLFDFGSSAGGELTGPGGGGAGQDYIQLAATRGTEMNTQRLGIRNLDPAFGGSSAGTVADGEQLLDTGLPTPLGEQFHYAVVYDSAAGQLRHYRDGTIAGTLDVTIELGNLNDVNNWLGRSNWTADSNFQGSFDEFRIYDNALDDAGVLASFEAGPDAGSTAAPVLELEVNTVTGNVELHNNQPNPIGFNFYEVSSPAGALNVTGWSSLSDQNVDAIGSGIGESWDEGGASNQFQLGEAFLLGGSEVASGGSLSLGRLYNPSVLGAGVDGDLTWIYSDSLGANFMGSVVYTDEPGPGGIPGDYNGNGRVEQADLDLVLLNWGTALAQPWVDGTVDQAELDGVLLNWGNEAGLGSAAGVPEPSAAILAVLILLVSVGAAARKARRS